MATNKYYQEVVASAARTTTGNSTAFDVSQADCLRLFLNITAVSGTTPTLILEAQDTPDGTNWFNVAAFTTVPSGTNPPVGAIAKVVGPANITATGLWSLIIPTDVVFGDNMRLRWTIAGTTPSFTFSVQMLAESGGY